MFTSRACPNQLQVLYVIIYFLFTLPALYIYIYIFIYLLSLLLHKDACSGPDKVGVAQVPRRGGSRRANFKNSWELG